MITVDFAGYSVEYLFDIDIAQDFAINPGLKSHSTTIVRQKSVMRLDIVQRNFSVQMYSMWLTVCPQRAKYNQRLILVWEVGPSSVLSKELCAGYSFSK